VSIIIPADRQGYQGRSHSLYYCDANEPGSYAWYETAFMFMPMLGRQGRQDPFALAPGSEAAKALLPGMSEYQVAWPFTRLVVDEIDDFLDRWLEWFAAAAQGQLHRPTMMPERPAEGLAGGRPLNPSPAQTPQGGRNLNHQ
jgi:serine/threonine-protein kinase